MAIRRVKVSLWQIDKELLTTHEINYIKLILLFEKVRPQFFVMENVKGMSKKIGEIKDDFKEFLGSEYQFDYMLLKAQDFGVPQNRERFIMIGNRMGIDPKAIFDSILEK